MGSLAPTAFPSSRLPAISILQTVMRPSLERLILATNDPHGMLGPEFSTLKKYLTKTQTGKELVGASRGHYTCF